LIGALGHDRPGTPQRNIASMSLEKTIEVVTKLAAGGAIKQYAIAGAVAALNYIQPTLTEDLDILVSVGDFRHHKGRILLAPIESALAEMGYTERSDVGIKIEGWPVQFLPAASALDEDGLAEAIDVDYRGNDSPFKARVLRAEHLVATAVKIGRLKDLARVDAFLEEGAVDLTALKAILDRFDLMAAWDAYCAKAGRLDLVGLKSII
jgi:hypothetical protein